METEALPTTRSHGIMKSVSRFPPAARTLGAVGMLASLSVASLQAQDLTGRSRIELRAGVGIQGSSGTSVGAGGVETSTESAGFLGALGYSRWFTNELAGTVSVGLLSVEGETRVGAGGVETRSAQVIPLFVGVRRYLASSAAESSTRLFGSVELGPVTGHEAATRVGSVIAAESITRTAFGGRLGAGVDFLLGSRFVLGIVAGYAFMTDFSDPIGGDKNHGGPDFGLSFGVLFGG